MHETITFDVGDSSTPYIIHIYVKSMMKVVIPAILAAILLIAGILAIMPIEKIQTVHTTIQTNAQGMRSVTYSDVVLNADLDDDEMEISAGNGFCILTIKADATDLGAGEAVTFQFFTVPTRIDGALYSLGFDVVVNDNDVDELISLGAGFFAPYGVCSTAGTVEIAVDDTGANGIDPGDTMDFEVTYVMNGGLANPTLTIPDD
jgi:hypothetical protein